MTLAVLLYRRLKVCAAVAWLAIELTVNVKGTGRSAAPSAMGQRVGGRDWRRTRQRHGLST